MVDTAAGASVLTREAMEAAKGGDEEGNGGVKVLGGEGETVDLTGTGGAGDGGAGAVKAFRVRGSEIAWFVWLRW